MTSKERILKAVRLEESRELPVAPYMGNHCARMSGIPLKDYYTKPEKIVEAQLKAWEIYHQDVVIAQSDNYYMAEAFGAEIDYHPDSIPTMKKLAVEKLSDVAPMRPAKPESEGRMPVYLEAIRLLHKEVGDELAIRGCGTGPFVMAGHLIGPENLLLELAKIQGEEKKGEAALLHLFDICCTTLINFSKLQLEAGATIVQCADSLASIDVISPEIYRKYVFPYEKRYFDVINPLCTQYDAASLLHICGNNTKIFELFVATGAEIIAVDHKADLREAKQACRGRACIIGNLDPSSLLLQADEDAVRESSRKAIEIAGKDGGFILGSGCEVAEYTLKENILAMIETARNVGGRSGE